MAASVSSGRPLGRFGSDLTMRAPLARSEIVTAACSTAAAAGADSGVTALGFTATTGTRPVTDAWTVQLPANTDWSVEPSCPMSVASVISPEFSLTASRPAISLPSGVALRRIAAGDTASASLGHRFSLWCHQVVRQRRVDDGQHLGGAVLAQLLRRGFGAPAQHHGDWVAEPAGQGQQLERRLAGLAIGEFGDNEDNGHDVPFQRYLPAIRKSAIAAAPDPPSSVIT